MITSAWDLVVVCTLCDLVRALRKGLPVQALYASALAELVSIAETAQEDA